MKVFLSLVLTLIVTSCCTESDLSPTTSGAATKEKSRFSQTTIDVGVVVSDIEKSLDFYQKIGFKEVSKFTASPEIAGKSGLLDFKSIDVHVLSLDGGNGTKVKLMQATKKAKSQEQKFIDSTYGISYLTVFVNDTKKTLARLKEHGILPYASGPVALGKSGKFLTCVKDPDGNFIELVGP